MSSKNEKRKSEPKSETNSESKSKQKSVSESVSEPMTDRKKKNAENTTRLKKFIDELDQEPKQEIISVKADKIDKLNNTNKKQPKTKKDKQPEQVDEMDMMQNALSKISFDTPVKKKTLLKPIKAKEIEINLENDSQEDIIRKLVLTVKNLKDELNEYKTYVEGTYCTFSVHNRVSDDLDKRVTILETAVENN